MLVHHYAELLVVDAAVTVGLSLGIKFGFWKIAPVPSYCNISLLVIHAAVAADLRFGFGFQ